MENPGYQSYDTSLSVQIYSMFLLFNSSSLPNVFILTRMSPASFQHFPLTIETVFPSMPRKLLELAVLRTLLRPISLPLVDEVLGILGIQQTDFVINLTRPRFLDQSTHLHLLPQPQVRQQAPLHNEKARVMFERFVGIDELDVVSSDKQWEDFVHFKERQMAANADMRATTKLEHASVHDLDLLLVTLQPPLGPEDVGILTENALMPVQDPPIYGDNRASRELDPIKLGTTSWDLSGDIQSDRGSNPHRFLQTGLEIWQILRLVVRYHLR